MRTSSSSYNSLPRRSRALLFTLTLGLAATLSACGDQTSTGAAQDPEVQIADLMISARDLPEGWRDSNSQGDDYRVTVCGVDLEPTAPTNAANVRFSQGPVGPFLGQYVRVYESDVAHQVAADLKQALAGCTEYEARGSAPHSPTARFVVEPLTVEGAPPHSVAWRQTSQGETPITSDLLLVPHGNAAVMLMSYALRDAPDTDVLEQAAAALPDAR